MRATAAASGRNVDSRLIRLYPKRMNSGNWIATLITKIAQDSVSVVELRDRRSARTWPTRGET